MRETGQGSGIVSDEREAEPGAGFAWQAWAKRPWQGLKRSIGRA